tara:strand:+ start:590 stop:946 length:357 start_codon:yes stop_codon:yes gene_type:complete
MSELEQPSETPSINTPEQQKLPNATITLVLGIASIATCCCYGFISIILAIVALVIAKKDLELYNTSPDLYSNYDHLKIGRILAFIGLGMGLVYLLFIIVYVVILGASMSSLGDLSDFY